MADIFISYKSERREAAAHLAKILECYGYSVWCDYHALDADDLAAQTAQLIDQAKAVIVLWCRLSADSDWVIHEAAAAAKLGAFVPAKIEPCHVSVDFGGNCIDLSEWNGAPFNRALFPLLDAITLRTGRGPQLDYGALRAWDEVWFAAGARCMADFSLCPSAQPTEEPLLLTTPLDEPTLSAVAVGLQQAQMERARQEEAARQAVEQARQRPADKHGAQDDLNNLAEELMRSLWGE
jgi:hypothetical protein